MMQRQYSARSEGALAKLKRFDELLTEHEKRFGALVANSAQNPPIQELLMIKNELAMMVGKIDKLQMSGIDSVMVTELDSGKEDAKKTRKELNARAETLSERIKELHGAIVAHLEKHKQ